MLYCCGYSIVGRMDTEYIINRDVIGTSSSSLSSPLLSIRGGGGKEQQTISQHSEFETTQTNSTRIAITIMDGGIIYRHWYIYLYQ